MHTSSPRGLRAAVLLLAVAALMGCREEAAQPEQTAKTAKTAKAAKAAKTAKATEPTNAPKKGDAAKPDDTAKPALTPPPGAREATDRLMAALGKRLKGAIAEGGFVGAVQACHVDAGPITAKAQGGDGKLRLGRTSHKLRNPDNAPPAWARDIVAAAAGKKVPEVQGEHVVALPDGGQGYLRVIGTKPMCVGCHGGAETLDAKVVAALDAAYPKDNARGFAPGDVRGWFWVEAR